MLIRDAAQADVPAITAIYGHHVMHGTGTFDETPPDQSEMAARLARITGHGWAWLVAEGEDGSVIGYAHYAPFRDKSGFRHAAEDSIYVRNDVRGQGVGKALVQALIERAQKAGFRQMVAIIGDAENVGSIGLHVSLGFRRVGVMKAVGLKFGRWLDVVVMQRDLGDGDRSLPTRPG